MERVNAVIDMVYGYVTECENKIDGFPGLGSRTLEVTMLAMQAKLRDVEKLLAGWD